MRKQGLEQPLWPRFLSQQQASLSPLSRSCCPSLQLASLRFPVPPSGRHAHMPGVLEPGWAGLGGALCLCRPWCEALLGRCRWQSQSFWGRMWRCGLGSHYIRVSQWQRQLRKGHREGGTQVPIQHLAKLHDSVVAMHLSLLGGRRHCVDSVVHDSLDMQKTLTRQATEGKSANEKGCKNHARFKQSW